MLSKFGRKGLFSVIKNDIKDNFHIGDIPEEGSLANGINLTDGPFIAFKFQPSNIDNFLGTDTSDLVPVSEMINIWSIYNNVNVLDSSHDSGNPILLSFEECNENNFPNFSKINPVHLNDFKGASLTGLEIQGDISNSKRKTITFQVDINATKVDIYDYDLMNRYFYGASFEFIIDNKFFDSQDIENPVKNYFQYESFVMPDSSHIISAEMRIRRNRYIKSDGYFPWSTEEENEFHSIERVQSKLFSRLILPPRDWTIHTTAIFEAKLYLDYEENVYERRVESLLEVTGQLGGIFEIYEIIGGFFIGWLSSNALNKEIYENLKKTEQIYENQQKILDEIKEKVNQEQ